MQQTNDIRKKDTQSGNFEMMQALMPSSMQEAAG
jgi:hypothetical protein